jgi:hypothetical protein
MSLTYNNQIIPELEKPRSPKNIQSVCYQKTRMYQIRPLLLNNNDDLFKTKDP